ncbi:hypothetical protein [Nocardia nova]|uniref:hypothetical protein n=1 Tax=Nocardia nova TaxID=37330 RepID=UPI0033EA8E41
MVRDGMEERVRPLPPTQVGDWVMLAPVSAEAKVLYWLLSAHMSACGHDGVPSPTKAMLAAVFGHDDESRVRPLLEELVGIDAVSIRTTQKPDGAGEVFVVNQMPADGFEGPWDLREFYARLPQ